MWRALPRWKIYFIRRSMGFGIPVRTETRKFNYVASISEPQPGFLSVDEYRADKLSLTGYPDDIASTGFATLALVFHPDMRDSFEMSCEGLGDWHGQASWLVRFPASARKTDPIACTAIRSAIRFIP